VIRVKTRKYDTVSDFILKSCKYRNENISLVMEVCKAVKQDGSINNKCFYCNFCYFTDLITTYSAKFEEIKINFASNTFFKNKIITVPNAKFYLNSPQNKNLYTFTSIEETQRIQVWATALLSSNSKTDVTTSIEIPVPSELSDRNGRIDIGAESNGKYLFIETKTKLSDAMSDERFVEQHAKYRPVIANYLNPKDFALLILIGGSEEVLYPPGHIHDHSDIGDLSKRFYKHIDGSSDRIPFISAPALWALSIKYMENNAFDIIKFLIDLFSDDHVLGLLSSGKVMKINQEYKIIEVEL